MKTLNSILKAIQASKAWNIVVEHKTTHIFSFAIVAVFILYQHAIPFSKTHDKNIVEMLSLVSAVVSIIGFWILVIETRKRNENEYNSMLRNQEKMRTKKELLLLLKKSAYVFPYENFEGMRFEIMEELVAEGLLVRHQFGYILTPQFIVQNHQP